MKISLVRQSAPLLSNIELIESYSRSKEMAKFVGQHHKENIIRDIYHGEMKQRGLAPIN